MAGIPRGIGGYACPSPLPTAPSEHSLSGVGPGGPTENSQSRAERSGLGRTQSRSHERERLGPKPLWPRDSSLVGGRVPACAGSTPASAWAEGLTGPLLLLSSEQRRPRCVCRSEIKQMTFIGKAIFFSTMFICQKNRL